MRVRIMEVRGPFVGEYEVRGGRSVGRSHVLLVLYGDERPSVNPVIAIEPLGDYQTNAFVVADEQREDACWLVDCGDRPEPLLDAVEASGRSLAGILLTYCHHDHIAGSIGRRDVGRVPIHHHLEAAWNQEPMLNLSALLGIPATATPPDHTFDDGDPYPLGPGWSILCRDSPGSSAFLHTPSRTLLAGDTLFAGSIGRIDFPTSDPAAMRTSVERLMDLDDQIRVLPGHGPGTTIGAERRGNPSFRTARPRSRACGLRASFQGAKTTICPPSS